MHIGPVLTYVMPKSSKEPVRPGKDHIRHGDEKK